MVAAASWAGGSIVLAAFFVYCASIATRPAAVYSDLSARAYRIRPFWLVTLGGTLAALLVASLPYLPYETSRLARYGVGEGAAHAVGVRALQYTWNLSTTDLRSGQPLDFQTTSLDVNHGFGVYDADDRLVGQVQAMPGVTNHLVLKLDAGEYTIRCLEYCGPGHAHMTSTFHVCGPGGC